MGARADTVNQTRQAIVEAARSLHSERGLAATGWDDIAERAGVSTATVYRHFPSLAELVPACARTVFDIIKPPTVAEASATFATLSAPADRFEQLVRYSCHCYEAGAPWLHAAHRERDFVPELDQALRVIEDTLGVLVTAAAGRRLARDEHRALFVLCDFPIWWSFTQGGLGRAAVTDLLARLVRTEVGTGLHPKE
jgi:AcrR family transcriptional regulator